MVFFRCFACVVALCFTLPAVAALKHHLDVTLDPATHVIEGTDRIELDADTKAIDFFLHANLEILSTDGTLIPFGDVIEGSFPPAKKYRVVPAASSRTITLHYRGEIYHPIAQASEEYARSFRETPGTIESEGVFLAQPSLWYPTVDGQMLVFELDTHLPKGWASVSQGGRHVVTEQHTRWTETHPQEEIYLIAAPFARVYAQAAGDVEAMVYLRDADDELAQNYLDATAQYLDMYQSLLGPYPYRKFALVENFWDTGYGMPSFTLLGPRIIRLPFIIYTSYPHEILHNWWGNGVYVDYEKGNWAEGLTAYLSDHLSNEQRGQGAQHRRQILQHYTDFVDENKDFPLTEFRSRHSSVTEAVGYGKTQMLFHMLRIKHGDEKFIKALQQFYAKYKFKLAGFADVEQVFSDVLGEDLSPFFSQWVDKAGAPALRLASVNTSRDKNKYRLTAIVEQTQPGEAYRLNLPVTITFEGEDKAYETSIAMTQKRSRIELQFDKRPVHIAIDPQFDVFRRLDREEIPPALSQAFGAEKALIVLPHNADPELFKAYRKFAEQWRSTQSSGIEIVADSDLRELPSDKSVWLLGYENRFLLEVKDALARFGSSIDADRVVIANEALDKSSDSVVVSMRNTKQPGQAVVVVATRNKNAVPGLARKIPHYRKYSYLAFSGDEPTNTLKGQWLVDRSPMQSEIARTDDQSENVRMGKLVPRAPLAGLPR